MFNSTDNYEAIKDFLKLYVKTGSTKTPTRGRGQRICKKKPFYEGSESDEEKENSVDQVKLIMISQMSGHRVFLMR